MPQLGDQEAPLLGEIEHQVVWVARQVAGEKNIGKSLVQQLLRVFTGFLDGHEIPQRAEDPELEFCFDAPYVQLRGDDGIQHTHLYPVFNGHVAEIVHHAGEHIRGDHGFLKKAVQVIGICCHLRVFKKVAVDGIHRFHPQLALLHEVLPVVELLRCLEPLEVVNHIGEGLVDTPHETGLFHGNGVLDPVGLYGHQPDEGQGHSDDYPDEYIAVHGNKNTLPETDYFVFNVY